MRSNVQVALVVRPWKPDGVDLNETGKRGQTNWKAGPDQLFGIKI